MVNLQRLGDLAPTPDDVEWYNVIGQFKKAAADFQRKYATVQNTSIDSAKFPELARLRQTLLSSGAGIRSTVQSITGAIDTAWNWLKTTFGFDGIREMDRSFGTMGIPILIPIAIVISAVAAITKWGLDYTRFYQTLQYVKELQAKGYSSVQINEMLNNIGKESPFLDFGNLAPVAFAGIAGFLGYLFWKNRR